MTIEAPPDSKPFKEFVPQEFQDRGYLKDLLDKPQGPETTVELFKRLDGAQTLIGKKLGIPAADAKPEEVEKFYTALRPEKAEEYEIKLGENPDEEFIKEVRAAFHTAGASKVQVQRFLEKLAPVYQAREKKQIETQAKLDKEFNDLVVSTLGPENEKILARVKEALATHTPAPLKPFIGKLDNNALALVAGVVNAILVKYVPEDDLNGRNKGGVGSGNDINALRQEAMKLMGSPEYKDFRHPDHEKTVKRVEEIYAQVK